MNTTPIPSPSPAPEPIGPGLLVLVVGPSGAGKDTVISGAKARCLDDRSVVFARRVVTRPATLAEDHDTITDAAFEDADRHGDFAFRWEAHGLKYGIPRTADDDIHAGRAVVCNVSRGIVASVQPRYANVVCVLITAPPDVLAARLAGRARDSDGPLSNRIARNDAFGDFRADHVIENTGAPGMAVEKLLHVIRRESLDPSS
jgi:ribose 1,5-bisphosphokinase